uniref:Uncharacterized protein n=1 Tax=Romanomermis culicivorax TaxID=13658 RepID=A0A915IK76_ROMCU
MTTTLLPTTASMYIPYTTVPPMPATSTLAITTTTTIPSQPKLVITTHPILSVVPSAGTNLHFELQLTSETNTLPNYVHFPTTNPLHSIMLAKPHYPPRMDSNVKSFLPRMLHEMVLINFFGRIRVCITMAVLASHLPIFMGSLLH